MSRWGSSLRCAIALLALVALLALSACAASGDSPITTGDDAGDDSSTTTGPVIGHDGATPDTSTPTGPHDSAAPDAGLPDSSPAGLAPVPVLTAVAPNHGIEATPGPTVVCTGSGFVDRSVVQLDGVALSTSFVSDGELRATIPDAKMLQVGTLHLTVGTAPPGGGGSAELLFQVVNPTPTITSLQPASALIGSASALLTVTGASFVPGASITFAGTALTTTVKSATTATATIPTASLATAGTYPITVVNPPPGGGASTSIAFTVANPTVVVSTVTPSSIAVGSASTPIALVGTGFVAASAVSFNGAAIASTFTDATHLSATIPGTALGNAGDFPIVVTNPAPGGGVSTPVTVHLVYPQPVATSIAPSSILLGAAPPTITVTGSGFLAGVSAIKLDGVAAATTVLDASHATATLTTLQASTAHVLQVTVTNPAPGGGTSAPLPFTVNDPVPVATSVTPSSAIVGAGDTLITVSGSQIVPTSSVLLGGTALTTTYVDPATLTAVIPASQLASATTLSIAVSSPAPGGGASGTLSFVVDNPGPTITQIAPAGTTIPAQDTAVTVSGTGFVSGVSVVQVNGAARATTYTNGDLGATIPAALLASAGTLSITVVNPAPGGGTSNVSFFTASDPAPTLASVAPTTITYGAADTPMTLTGTGFVAASVVKVNGAAVTSNTQSGGLIVATLPAAMLKTASNLTVTVTNPAPGGGTSAGATIAMQCDTTGATQLSTIGAATSFTLTLGSAPTASRITTSNPGGGVDSCPRTADTAGTEPYRTYVVVNTSGQSATLSAWAVCATTDDGFLTFYNQSAAPTGQTALEQCTGVVSEGASGAGGFNSKEPGTSSYCPGLTKANGRGLTLPACGRAVVLIQAWSTTSTSYTPPTTLKVALE